jgi:hypothetical protein
MSSPQIAKQPRGPLEILHDVESRGYKLRVDSQGRLVGPKSSMPVELRSEIQEHKFALIGLITHQCHECNQPLRTVQDDDYVYLQCVTDAIHFTARLYPRLHKRVNIDGLTEGYGSPCESCGWSGLTFDKRCLICIEAVQSL